MKIKIAVVQMNPIVGALADNTMQIYKQYLEASDAGADLVVFPECALSGYPLEDLVIRPSFMEGVSRAFENLMLGIFATKRETGIIFGAPISNHDGTVSNAAHFYPGWDTANDHVGVPTCHIKRELPNYGVFDEKRVFKSGVHAYAPEWRGGHKIGIMICEDTWFPNVTKDLISQKPSLIISINGSPFEAGKNVIRKTVVAKRIKESGVPFLYVNLVGGQDELVFDGGSFLMGAQGEYDFPFFKEGIFYVEHDLTDKKLENFPHRVKVKPTSQKEIYQALVMGTKDFHVKQGFTSDVLGYSGGVDSGLVAAIACDAMGPENVHLVRLPSKYSSQGSLDDAAAGAERLGAKMRTIHIEPVVDALRAAYTTAEYAYPVTRVVKALTGVADENIQARARGNILMAISNQEGHMLLTTGNKSEVSVGYATLYGDMSGGFNPIKDCYKSMVWDLCMWRNQLTAEEIEELGFKGRATIVVPQEIIDKAPSAELAPDQLDSNSLPDYRSALDPILNGIIEQEKSCAELAHQFGIEPVFKVRNLVDRAEYKRRQAAPGVKITSKIHGRDRRYPIVNKWRA